MGMLGEWRATRERRRLAAAYLHALLPNSEPADVQWLTSVCGDANSAQRELAFARRALALIVAERDALDDRTASDVARELAAFTEQETRRDDGAGKAWATRWRTYTEALALRGAPEAPAVRLARVLLSGTGLADPSPEIVARASQCIHTIRAKANESLRAVYGVASLPDDIRPSAMRS